MINNNQRATKQQNGTFLKDAIVFNFFLSAEEDNQRTAIR